MNKTWIVAQREFNSRVKKKTFLLSTILFPLLIFGFYALMIYFSVKGNDDLRIAIADRANVFNGKLESDKEVKFEFVNDTSRASLDQKVAKKEFSGYIFIPANYNPLSSDTMNVFYNKTIGMISQERIERRVNKLLEQKRLLALNITQTQLDSARRSSEVEFKPISGEKDKNKAGLSYAVGFISGFLIYIILFIYGTMVMRGVAEEKVTRIAEVIVSSVKPFQLMMGKIIGIGAVGLLQFIIWILLGTVTMAVIPLLTGGDASAAQNIPGGAGAMATAAQSGAGSAFMAVMDQINFALLLPCFLFYFLGGYLLYSSLFAAVGSAVNEDPQDAQSLILPITLPIIFGIVIMTKAVNDPTSNLAIFGSLFPLTSPVVMMARIAHGVPDGVSALELVLSMVFLVAGFLFTTWMAGKIYRTGILMYGKKPTWKEMWKWAFRNH
ncbi:ABC transporter permease [Paraflavitalea sp. CAU 1676]|uniref:ABC transporter permease n=1 Tax=Paraflavitalea sp. CAU 1676 TaxID=3032598 RepID=UPI0023DA05B9|nr:ABC transporter permease [Paraflavitalea sp. CAU 1676]MDF2187680.1 ABC transporter permease [Paraflavitalea sp. CAU 1676]